MSIKFTQSEITALEKHPDALRALADQHSIWATEAESIGPEFYETVSHHDARRDELSAAADEIESEYY